MRGLTVIAAAAALSLVACGDGGGGGGGGGGGDGGAPGGGDVDTCELLTTDEVEAAVGNPVNDATPDIANSCQWDSDDPDERSVSVHLLAVPDRQFCVDALATDSQYDEAEGFGDPAFTSYNPSAGGLADVVVCAAGQFQLIVVGGLSETGTETELRTAAEDLAGTAFDRL